MEWIILIAVAVAVWYWRKPLKEWLASKFCK